MKPKVLMVCAMMVWTGLATCAMADEISVTPYRPTVTNSAGLSTPGWVQLESSFAARFALLASMSMFLGKVH